VETRNDLEKVNVLDLDVSDMVIVRLPWEMYSKKSLVCYKKQFCFNISIYHTLRHCRLYGFVIHICAALPVHIKHRFFRRKMLVLT